MWKFYALGWKPKTLEKFTNVAVGFDEPIGHYLAKNRDIKSFSRSKSFVKRVFCPSFDFRKKLEELIDDFIFDFQKKRMFPGTLGIRVKKYNRGHYKEESKSSSNCRLSHQYLFGTRNGQHQTKGLRLGKHFGPVLYQVLWDLRDQL
jgi:hypothetical protein